MAQSVFGPKSPRLVESTTGLITYLRDMVRSSRRAVRDTSKFEEVVWLRDIPENLVHVPGDSGDDEEGLAVITLEFEPRVAAPQPPRVLDGWLDGGAVHDPFSAEPGLRAPHDVPRVDPGDLDSASSEHALEVRSYAQRVHDAYAAWIGDWRVWSARRQAAAPRQELYDRLARIARAVSDQDDVFEAVLATGLLVCQPEDGERIHRHLITRRLRVTVDKATARIEVSLDPYAPLQWEDGEYLHAEAGFRLERAATAHERIAVCPQHPLSALVVELIQDWSRLALDRPLRFRATWQAPEEAAADAGLVHIAMAPAIVQRVRNRNLVVEVYDRILTELSGADVHVPLSLAQLVAPLTGSQRSAWATGTGRWQAAPLDQEPLFPLATNPEQRDVLDRLQRETAVVVQGPPGTGKTHTIANLTAALLAQGQRVLVTSQKDQALSVLRDKVPEAVRDLCVALASGDHADSGALERTLNALSDRAASMRPQRLEASIRDLQERRSVLLQRRAELEEEIRCLRETEALVHEPAPGYEGTPVDLTYQVAKGTEHYSWMPPPPSGAPSELPIGVGLLAQLRDLTRSRSHERRARMDQWLPAPETVPSAEEFTERIARIESGTAAARELDQVGKAVAPLDLMTLAQVEGLVQQAADSLHHLGVEQEAKQWRRTDWRTKALADALARRNLRAWERIAASADAAEKCLDSIADLNAVNLPRLQPEEYASFLSAARAWSEYLRSGGRPRKVFPADVQVRVRPFLSRCTISGTAPVITADISPIITRLQAAVHADQIDELWRSVKVRPEPADLAARLEQQTEQARALGRVREFGRTRDELDQVLLTHGVRIPLDSEERWDAFTAALISARAHIQLAAEIQALDDLAEALTPRSTATPAPEVKALRAAVRARDTAAYDAAHADLALAERQQADEDRLRKLFADLHAAHPALARLLAETADDRRWDDPPAIARAWSWAVAAAFCEHTRTPGRDQELGDELSVTEQRLLEVTGELAGAKGWLHCLARLDRPQRQALEQLRSHLGAVGAGDGRYADRSRAAARGAMATARSAVPAWIMPLYRVIETLPIEADSFDVVIVDEASQVGLDGLFLLWLAPRMIVVGDNRQCVPGYSGGEYQRLFDRLDDYLPDVPLEDRHMFRPRMNLYELLSARFPEVVRLNEHFRCMPQIIGWSSEQFYNRSLIALRRFGADHLKALNVEPVHGAYQEGRGERIHNPVEAKQIVEKLQELLADPRYEERSFGIITLQGSAQARRIEQLVVQSIAPPSIVKHDIRVGKPADFQGDERDVILLSMVAATSKRTLRSMDDQRRFNVAASRARDQMWLFTSLPSGQLKPEDLRASLLAYMLAPPATATYRPAADLTDVRADSRHKAFDSLFEQRVYLRIRERGYAVVPQVPVGAKRIDLVLYGTDSQLAVECDGDHWHSTLEQQRQDIHRERELVRAGWQFWRVRESDFAHDPDAALTSLWTALAARRIEPGVQLSDEETATARTAQWAPVELPDSDEDDDAQDDEEDPAP